jgi:ElaA protein
MERLIKSFRDLSTFELFQIYELRAMVFVVEQNCPYQDVDALDLEALHVFFMEENRLTAYARIIAPHAEQTESKIGRVVVHPDFRGRDLGRTLMKLCIKTALEQFDSKEVVISAQTYLLRFYTELGFISEGESYLEDELPHQRMRLTSHTTTAT